MSESPMTVQRLREAADKAEREGGRVKLHPAGARDLARIIEDLQRRLTQALSERDEAWYGDNARRRPSLGNDWRGS